MRNKYRTQHILEAVMLALLFSSCSYGFPDPTDAAETSISHPQPAKRVETYIYKQTPQGELAIHVHFPPDWSANDKRAAIVFFFGGGWSGGSVKEFVSQAEYLAGRGMVTARADYRVKNRHGTRMDKCVEDGKSAVRWLRANAAKLGIDPSRIAASGYSAGGHIAACTYTTQSLEAEGEDLSVSSKPNLLVLFAPGCLRITPGMRLGVGAEMAIKISPYHNLSKEVPPAFLFYGTNDLGLVLWGIDFIEKSKKLGTIAELYSAEGVSHFCPKKSPWLERTIYLMDKFLARYGYTRGEPTIKLPEGKVEIEKITPIKWGYTPLHSAACDGHKELAELLISNGADVNAKDSWGCTPLFHAVRHAHKELAEILIANGADVNAKDKWGCTPLPYAVGYIYKELVEILIANGADATFTNEGYSTILYAAWFGDKDTVRLLITKGADVNFTPKGDYPPLHYAVWGEDIKLAKLYVNYGARFDMKDQDGWTALRYVVAGGNCELLEFLVAKGANVSDFHMAAWQGDLSRVKHFVEQGTNVDTKDNELKWTPLCWAASTRQQDVVGFLITKGASVNVKDESNSTPLHGAAGAGHRELVELLLAKGADVNAKTEKGQTAVSLAKKKGHTEIVELLRKHGAKK
ncbi:MAG: ankyrin repeat domain-containing protein [Planctomycetota bacterium]|jgi:ankyrin repeat protein/acetyl esterase/lipase